MRCHQVTSVCQLLGLSVNYGSRNNWRLFQTVLQGSNEGSTVFHVRFTGTVLDLFPSPSTRETLELLAVFRFEVDDHTLSRCMV